MPYVKKYPAKKKKGKKKVKPSPKQPSKMSYKELMRKTPEAFTDLNRLKVLHTVFRSNWYIAFTGTGAAAYVTQYTQPMDQYDPSGAVGIGQPYLFDQLMALYQYGHAKRVRLTFDFSDNSTTTATAYYVFAVADASPSNVITPTIQNVDDLLQQRDRRIRPAYSLVQSGTGSSAGGRRKLKLEFDMAKLLGYSKESWNATEVAGSQSFTLTASPGTPLGTIWYGIVSQSSAAIPATVSATCTVRCKTLVKLYRPYDMGPS